MFGYTLPLTQGEKFIALIADLKRPLKRARSILGTADVYGLGLDHVSKLVIVVMFITSPIRAVAKVIDAILGLMLSEDNLLRVALKQLVKFSVALTFACIDSAIMLLFAPLKIVRICLVLMVLMMDLVNHLSIVITAIVNFVFATFLNLMRSVLTFTIYFFCIMENTHFLAILGVFLLYSYAYVGALVAGFAVSIVWISEIWTFYCEVCYYKYPGTEGLESISLLMLIASVIIRILLDVPGLFTSIFFSFIRFLNVIVKMFTSILNHLFFFSRMPNHNVFYFEFNSGVDLRTDWQHADGCLGLSCGIASDVLFQPVKAVYRVMLPTNEEQHACLDDSSDDSSVDNHDLYHE